MTDTYGRAWIVIAMSGDGTRHVWCSHHHVTFKTAEKCHRAMCRRAQELKLEFVDIVGNEATLRGA